MEQLSLAAVLCLRLLRSLLPSRPAVWQLGLTRSPRPTWATRTSAQAQAVQSAKWSTRPVRLRLWHLQLIHQSSGSQLLSLQRWPLWHLVQVLLLARSTSLTEQLSLAAVLCLQLHHSPLPSALAAWRWVLTRLLRSTLLTATFSPAKGVSA